MFSLHETPPLCRIHDAGFGMRRGGAKSLSEMDRTLHSCNGTRGERNFHLQMDVWFFMRLFRNGNVATGVAAFVKWGMYCALLSRT